MKRLGELDFPDRTASLMPTWASQIVFAFFALSIAVVMRLAADAVWPGAPPFGMALPAVLIATLYARWQSGMIALVIITVAAWYFVLPPRVSFELATPADGPRILLNFIAGIVVVAIAELFRRATRRLVDDRDARIAERDLMLLEIDHRVKNNFASVVSLIDLQRRGASDMATREALGEALGRVESIARAHNALYRDASCIGMVELKPYAEQLCVALEQALFLRGSIKLECFVEPVALSRDRVISIGLLINELVTNSAKHAFPDRPTGNICVEFSRAGGGYELMVRDDGIGMPSPPNPDSLGMKLVSAFARDAGGQVSIETGKSGTTVRVHLQA